MAAKKGTEEGDIIPGKEWDQSEHARISMAADDRRQLLLAEHGIKCRANGAIAFKVGAPPTKPGDLLILMPAEYERLLAKGRVIPLEEPEETKKKNSKKSSKKNRKRKSSKEKKKKKSKRMLFPRQ